MFFLAVFFGKAYPCKGIRFVEDLQLELCDVFGKDFSIDLRGLPRLISGNQGSLAGIYPNLPIKSYTNYRKRVFDTVLCGRSIVLGRVWAAPRPY